VERSTAPAPWGAGRLDEGAEQRFVEGVEACGRFFMGTSDVHLALWKLVSILEAEGIPYAVIGGLALNEYGHRRVTADVDVILRDDDFENFKRTYLGHGYAERVPATGKLMDTEHGVPVEVLGAGRYPGDGKPKPIQFPDPAVSAIRGDRFALLPLGRFLELKLASGMSAPHRLKDLADVIELVRSATLPEATADGLHPYVREKFRELWSAAQAEDPYSLSWQSRVAGEVRKALWVARWTTRMGVRRQEHDAGDQQQEARPERGDTYMGSVSSALPSLAFVRLEVTPGGTTPAAWVRLYVTGRSGT
jgi:hypothetical protein